MRIFPTSRGLNRPAADARRQNTCRLSVEPLEPRDCPSYTVLDLGALPGMEWSEALAVNASGHVVGRSGIPGVETRAFLWQNGVISDLGYGEAADINDTGQIVGWGPYDQACLWQGGVRTELGELVPDGGSNAHAINDNGQVVGWSMTSGGVEHAFVWENGVMYDLNNLVPGGTGLELLFAWDFNDSGQIVGDARINGQRRAFLVTDNDGVFANGGAALIDLGTLGGAEAWAYDLNSSGQVAGSANVPKWGARHAFLYSNDTMSDLGTLGGYTSSDGYAINDAGQVVGSSMKSGPNGPVVHAFRWQNQTMTDLNSFLPRKSSWALTRANDINNAGHIVGNGTLSGQRRAFLMVPGNSALQAESSITRPATEALSLGQAQPLLAEALARWQAVGANTSSLSGVEVRIADLGGTTLGLASGHTIWLDDDAAGWGWFVDPTPGDDSEFTTPGDQGEQGRMDLLTALAHELGHLLGLDHDDEGVMDETLTPGTRRVPMSSDTGTAPTVGPLAAPRPASSAANPSDDRSALGLVSSSRAALALDHYFAAIAADEALAVAVALAEDEQRKD
jgi:probable HAF family extracellular repeat protein